MLKQTFKFVEVLADYLERDLAEIAIFSGEFSEALLQDFHQLGSAANDAEAFFNAFQFSQVFRCSPLAQIQAWERVLYVLNTDNPQRYKSLHKGTPFYFLGVASYVSGDFERAMFYLDSALSSDYAIAPNQWHVNPAG